MPDPSPAETLKMIEELERLEREATAGGLTYRGCGGVGHDVPGELSCWELRRVGGKPSSEDFALVVALRNNAPALLALARRAIRVDAFLDIALADEHDCLVCDRYDWPESSYHKTHARTCPLVVSGLIDQDGKRTEQK